jgi:hypothetical protein
MHSLTELVPVLVKYGQTIKEFFGWYIRCENGDQWTMLDGVFYKNNDPITKKELIKYLEEKLKKRTNKSKRKKS